MGTLGFGLSWAHEFGPGFDGSEPALAPTRKLYPAFACIPRGRNRFFIRVLANQFSKNEDKKEF